MNQNLFNFFYNLSQNDFFASLAVSFSNKLTYLFVFLLVVWALLRKGKEVYTFYLFVLTCVSSWLFAHVLKSIFHIERPFIQMGIEPLSYESGFSFPSEHTAVLTALSYVVYSVNRKLGIVCFIFTLLVAISRVVIGVHYPVDIIGGVFSGLIVGFVLLKIFKKIKWTHYK